MSGVNSAIAVAARNGYFADPVRAVTA